MTCNVGGTERPIRMGLGLLAIAAGLLGGFSSAVAGVMLGAGLVLVVTGLVGFCPLFTLLGINTCTPTSSSKK
ncbi:MAG: DUF2892 domain-containing protein [Nitrospira sp.]